MQNRNTHKERASIARPFAFNEKVRKSPGPNCGRFFLFRRKTVKIKVGFRGDMKYGRTKAYSDLRESR